MPESILQNLKRTPLCAAHQQLGARLVEFCGWLMPVQYTSIFEEHQAVRRAVGVFDISHMGEFWVSGPQSAQWLNTMLTNDVARLAPGQAQYTLLCNERGGVIDDLVIYRIEPQKFLLVVNAANIERDLAWLRSHLDADVELDDASNRTAALALQGPKAAVVMDELVPGTSQRIRRFCVQPLVFDGIPLHAARTGYTGEDGFELMCAADGIEKLWNAVLTAGAPLGIKPCGLGARDTLRLEMCYPLHGHELTEDITPLEAGLEMFVAFGKNHFLGKDALMRQRQRGVARRLVPFRMQGKAPPPRQHYPIMRNGVEVGEVTSGSISPSLGVGIGMGFVVSEAARVGEQIQLKIRDRCYNAVVEKRPLYRRAT